MVHGRCPVDRLASTFGGLLDTAAPLLFESFVESFLATGLPVLQVAILLLEAASVLLASKYLFHERPLSLLVLDAATEELGRTLNNCANLAVFRRLHLAAVFPVVTMWIQDITHFEELQVSLEFWREVGLG